MPTADRTDINKLLQMEISAANDEEEEFYIQWNDFYGTFKSGLGDFLDGNDLVRCRTHFYYIVGFMFIVKWSTVGYVLIEKHAT